MNRKWWKFLFLLPIASALCMPEDTQHNLLKTIRNGLLPETLPATEPIRKQLLYTH